MTSQSNYAISPPTGASQQQQYPFPQHDYQQQQHQPQQQLPFPQYHQQQAHPQQHQQYQQYPQQQVRPGQARGQEKPRPRSRGFSFRSDKSQKSAGGSHHKPELIETHAEKEAKRLHSKADPTLAMNEAEPATVAAGVKSSLASLRSTSHRDTFGNPISDPDRSNPTRSRWERPLDTIRGFEAAIDGGYNNRKSYIRSDSDSVANWNRRSSYYGNNNASTARFPQDSYYGGRPNSFMPSSSQYDLRQPTPGNLEQGQQGQNAYSNGPGNGRQRYSRMASEPHFNAAYNRQSEQSVYPMPNNHRSYETVGSGSGASGEPAGYQTDPTSSDNSSIERVQSPPKRQPEPVNDYGIGFSQTPTYQPSAFTLANGPRSPMAQGRPQQQQQQQQQNSYATPPVPTKDNSMMRKPTAPMPGNAQAPMRPDMGDKRKSWFSRRFSKQG